MSEIKLPAEFQSGNSVPVERATITRQRVAEILAEAIEADRKRQGDSAKVLAELVALIPLADTLNASASCQDLIDYFKGVIADRKRRGESVACFKCGHSKHNGECVNVAPQPAEPDRGEPVAYPVRVGCVEGRLAKRPYQTGDNLPAVGSYCLISGANCDIESDQQRGYSWRQVLGYSDDKKFICLQTSGCWPTVERLTKCWFADIPHPMGVAPQPADPSGTSTLHNADSGAQNAIQATQTAEPVGVPSDAELEKAWDSFEAEMARHPTDDELEEFMAQFADEMGHIHSDQHAEAARAILARYGAQPAASADQRIIGYIKIGTDGCPRAQLTTAFNQNGEVWRDDTKIYAAPVAAGPSVPDTIYLGCARMGMTGASDEEVLNYVRVATQKAATPRADNPPPKEPL